MTRLDASQISTPSSGRASLVRDLLRSEDGQAMVEYGLIAGAIVVGLYVGANGLMALQRAVFVNHQSAIKDWRAP